MKRFICITLAAALLLSAAAVPAFAASSTASGISSLRSKLARIKTAIDSVLKGVENKKNHVDESDIPSAPPAVAHWQEYTEPLFEGAPAQSLTAQVWRTVELTFESETAYADPFNDVTLDLLLLGSDRLYTVPGFWDGGNTWKIRFVCPTQGVWQFKTVCSDPENVKLHGKTGEVNCTAYSGTLDVYQHGFVTTAAGKKYFTYDDGAPFFYLGDTHWSLGDETPDMVKEIAEKRAAQGYTVWQSEPIGEKFDLTDGVSEADLAGFHAYDEKFQIIADAGLTHANAQFFYPTYMDRLIAKHGGYTGSSITGKVNGMDVTVNDLSGEAKQYLEQLSRYWVARYGAYPVIWTLGQEVDNDFYFENDPSRSWNALNNPYKLVAAYIEKYDVYSHPLSAHQENADCTAAYGNGSNVQEEQTVYQPKASASAFRDVPAHSFYAAQWSPILYGNDESGIPKDYWYNAQGKPVINYEGRYCYLWTKNFGARVQGWTAYLNGMYGCSWGGQDTWSYLNPYGEDQDSDDGVDVITAEEKSAATWRDALDYPSSYQVCYMRSFLEDGNWWELIPRFDNRAYFIPDDRVISVCAVNQAQTEYVLYFYSFTDPSVAERPNTSPEGGLATGTVGQLKPGAEYIYQWFDPINGEYGETGTFKASALGTWSIGPKPSATDWALRITPKEKTPFLQKLKDFFAQICAWLKHFFPKKEEPKEVDESNMIGGDFCRIFPNMGVCDPHVHIYDGKAYLFSSHDRGPGQPIYRMDDWRIFFSEDLVNWKLEATIHPEDTFLGPCEECYAVDSAERNGKYYFYFSHQQYQTGVMVSENGPAGPYKDALGAPLLPPRIAETPSYDPTVFIDDDEAKTPYIMWGFTLGTDHYYVARLNEDMISLAEEPQMVEIENGWQNDACWLSKFNGVYYLNSHEGDYATSDSIYGPYVYRGKICRDCFTDHGTFFTFNNQTYFTYAVPENYGSGEPLDRYFRTMKIVYAHLKDNGEIVTDEFIKKVGVGQYDAAWDVIKGEWFFDASDGVVKKETADGFALCGITDGAHLTFPKIKNMPKNAVLQLRAANGNDAPCTVEVRKENQHGELLGKCTVTSTGGFDAFQTFEIPLKNTAGTHGLCFVFRSEADEALWFEDMRFKQ